MKRKFYFLLVLFLQVAGSLYAINPVREYVITPDSLNMSYENLVIDTKDGAKLNSWAFIQKTHQKPFIVISYGDAGNMGNVLFQARALFEAGYNVIIYDYRGFGKSSDFEMNRDQIYYDEFITDLSSVLKVIDKKYRPSKTFLMGLSMGSIVSYMVSRTHKVDGLIFDSFVVDPFKVKERIGVMKNRTLVLPASAQDYVSSLQKSKQAMIVFQGIEDQFTTVDDVKEYSNVNKNTRLFPGQCNHLQSFYKMTDKTLGDLYIKEILTFTSNH